MFYVDSNQKANFELSYEFPLAVHETSLTDKPGGINDWHWHEELQFTYVLEGEMILSSQGADHVLSEGCGIFINSNCAHMSRQISERSARYLSLNIQPSLLTLYHGSVVEQKYFLPYVDDPGMQVVTFFPEEEAEAVCLLELRRLFEVLKEDSFGYELEAYSQLLHLWNTLLNYARSHARTQPQPERQEAHDMLSYIHRHYSEELTLEAIAREVHLSKGECCRMFRSAYGCSIFTHIMNYRVAQSIPLLTGTNLSMAEISESCGFHSPSYFTKNFRERVGVTPLQYRKNGQSEKMSVPI